MWTRKTQTNKKKGGEFENIAMETVKKRNREGSKQVSIGKGRDGGEKEEKRRYCRKYNTYVNKIFDNNSIKDGRREISEYYCKVFYIIYIYIYEVE